MWTDQQLTDAVKASTNWRSVLRALGYGDRSSSAGAIRIVRRRALQLGLDSSHFRGKRRWSDAQLRQAVSDSRSWDEVLTRLGLSAASGNAQPHVKGHAVRLGLDTGHLDRLSHHGRQPAEAPSGISGLATDPRRLRVAAPTIAASWFALRGCAVSFPFEPATYDLLVEAPGRVHAVQVKTSTYRFKDSWLVTVGHHPDTHARKGHLIAYDPDVIDLFFIIDGDMTMYLIPSRALAGRCGYYCGPTRSTSSGTWLDSSGLGRWRPRLGFPPSRADMYSRGESEETSARLSRAAGTASYSPPRRGCPWGTTPVVPARTTRTGGRLTVLAGARAR